MIVKRGMDGWREEGSVIVQGLTHTVSVELKDDLWVGFANYLESMDWENKVIQPG